MALIKSISGIRGTIGGVPGDNLTPIDIVQCAAGFGAWILEQKKGKQIVIGQDGRVSGAMVRALCTNTLTGMGLDVLDLGYSTTPTVEMEVIHHQAAGGIIITASHNPMEWNALKLLNCKGEFISAADGERIIENINRNDYRFASWDHLGKHIKLEGGIERHITKILQCDFVNTYAVRKKKYKIVADHINSTGILAIPPLLEALGAELININDDNSGFFAHNPEPLKEHLNDLSAAVLAHSANLGLAVDPDVDRLVIIDENGEMFGEEYTLVSIADYILSKRPGPAVSNLSSSRALKDVCKKHNCTYFTSAVGEVNVVAEMKRRNASIGGEGNGGIILPDLHYGRDAMAGIALFLSHLAEQDCKVSELRNKYPRYEMIKEKIDLPAGVNLNALLSYLENKYMEYDTSTIDGLKIDFEDAWLHLRKSNTEPIIRLYGEGKTLSIIHQKTTELKTLIQSFQ
jgi:phosphomannomutase